MTGGAHTALGEVDDLDRLWRCGGFPDGGILNEDDALGQAIAPRGAGGSFVGTIAPLVSCAGDEVGGGVTRGVASQGQQRRRQPAAGPG